MAAEALVCFAVAEAVEEATLLLGGVEMVSVTIRINLNRLRLTLSNLKQMLILSEQH